MIDKLGRNDACWCGSGQKYQKCPAFIDDMLKRYMAKDLLRQHAIY
jgi:methionyl aminopeptidase